MPPDPVQADPVQADPVQADPVQAVLAEVLRQAANADPAAMTRSSRLREDLGINSLTLIDVACAAEDRFGVRIPDDDLERFVTLGDAVDFLHAAKVAGRRCLLPLPLPPGEGWGEGGRERAL